MSSAMGDMRMVFRTRRKVFTVQIYNKNTNLTLDQLVALLKFRSTATVPSTIKSTLFFSSRHMCLLYLLAPTGNRSACLRNASSGEKLYRQSSKAWNQQ